MNWFPSGIVLFAGAISVDGGEDMNDDTAAMLNIDGTTSFTGNAAKNSSGGEEPSSGFDCLCLFSGSGLIHVIHVMRERKEYTGFRGWDLRQVSAPCSN